MPDSTTPTARMNAAIARLADAAAELERMACDLNTLAPYGTREPDEADVALAEAAADAATMGVSGLWQMIGNRRRRATWGGVRGMKADLSAAALLLADATAILQAGAEELLDVAAYREARNAPDEDVRQDATALLNYVRALKSMRDVVDNMAKEPAA